MNLGGSIRINKCGLLICSITLLIILYYISLSKTPNSHYNKNPNEVNLRKLLIGSIQAARAGGIEVLEVSKDADFNVQSKGKTLEGVIDPVTDADFRSHCVMQHSLHRLFPRLTIISEEDNSKNKCPDVKSFDLDPTVLHDTEVPDENVDVNDVSVWIDPLDATKEYTEKLFEYVTTMVCVAVKGRPIIGVIHNPFTGKTIWSWEKRVLSEELRNVKRDEDNYKNPVIIVSRSHAGDVKNFSKLAFGEKARIINAAGAGYKVLQVVFNNASAYIHTTNIKKWDLCAGNAILNAVGGKMTNLLNAEIDYSKNEHIVNEKGLLASVTNHNVYMDRIIKNKLFT